MAKRMSVSQFKEQRDVLLGHLGSEGLIITKRGKPVAHVAPARSDCKELIGSLKGRIRIKGDVFSAGLKWDAQFRPVR